MNSISTTKHWIPFICVMKFLIDYMYFGVIPGITNYKLSDDPIPFEIKDVRCLYGVFRQLFPG